MGIEEKPAHPKSNYAVTGIYMYDATVFEKIQTLKPSGRSELEITDVNNAYIREGTMTFSFLDGWWTDAGTFESLLGGQSGGAIPYSTLTRNSPRAGAVGPVGIVHPGASRASAALRQFLSSLQQDAYDVPDHVFQEPAAPDAVDQPVIETLQAGGENAPDLRSA